MFLELEEVKKKDDSWPEPRSGHRMCADENYLYVFGGYDPTKDNHLYNELWRYNISTEKWVKLPDENRCAPLQCASSTMLLWQNKLIIFGGSGYPFAEQNSNKLYVYCLKTYQWIDLNEVGSKNWPERRGYNAIMDSSCSCCEIHCNEPPIPKYGHSMALSESSGELFIFSGTTGRSFTEELHKFNLNEFTWNLIEFCPKHREERPCGRYRHEVVWNDKEFYIFGGSTLNDTFGIEVVYSFDFKTYSWSKHSCSTSQSVKRENGDETFVYPNARKAHTCVLYKDNMYMVGGINGNTQFRDIWSFSLKTKTWYFSNKLKFPRKVHFHSGAVTKQGCMYIFGGIDEDFIRRSDLYKMWLCAPSLKEQAWLKIAQILKRNNQLNKEVLLQLGIPKNFHGRLNDSCVPAA